MGPTAPPRFPRPFIRPMEAAELSLVKDSWGIFQKTGRNVNIPIADIVKNIKDTIALDMVKALKDKPINAVKNIIAVRRFLSPFLSEYLNMNISAIAATMYGISDRKLASAACTCENDFIMDGSQIEYP